MKGFGKKNQQNNKNLSKIKQKLYIDQLIQKAFQLQALGKKAEAAKY